MESLYLCMLMIIIAIAINAIVVLAPQTQNTMGEFDAAMFHATIEKSGDEEGVSWRLQSI